MSSDNPPYPYYNGIPFNPSFFTSDTTGTTSGGFTEAEANTKYLLKTIPDIATALETFNAGIVTPSVSSTGDLSILSNKNSVTNISNGNGFSLGDATGAVNIKSGDNNTGTITIGKYTASTNQTTTTINGNTNIANAGGIVNIATVASRTTAINIGTGNSVGPLASVNINNGALGSSYTSINNGFNSTGGVVIGDSNANTTQTCYINSGQIGIGTLAAPTDNSRNITIGATDGAFNSNTALNGITTISKPTIARPISFSGFTAPVAGQMFFNTNVTSGGFFTATTTYKAYAPVNNLTQGTYLFLGFVYLADYSPATKIASTICYSNTSIANDQSTLLNLVNQNTLEAYGYKATTGATGGHWTMNLSTVYTIPAAPNNNIAVAVQTGVSALGLYVDIKYCRLA